MATRDTPNRWRFAGASPIWHERFATRLARLVAVARDPAGVLLEWRAGAPGMLIAAPGTAGAELVRSAADGMDGRLVLASDLPRPGWPGPTRLGAFDALPRPDLRFPLEPAGARETSGPVEESGPTLGGAWVVQLHLRGTRKLPPLEGSLRLGVAGDPPDPGAVEAELVGRLTERLARAAVPATFRPLRPYRWHRREWANGALRRFRSAPPLGLTPTAVGQLARFAGGAEPPPIPAPSSSHVVVLGASGAGKTTLLARWGAESIRSGRPVVAVDVHGDLAPALAALLSPEIRSRVVAVDAAEPDLPVPGVDVMAGALGTSAPRIVAALRRTSDDGGEVYWGFRLERIFDHFVRLVLEEGGNLRDLYDLLTNDARREAARLSTRDPAQARFLDELRGILRRNPEFLWPAAARIAKVALEGPVTRLVAPLGEGVSIERLLAEGRSVLFRLSLGELGPEGAQLAATLLLARTYFGRVSAGPGVARPLVLLVDEAQTVAPSLLAEILADGRKFGITALVATQYPGRLEGRLRDAAAGAATTHVVLRTPRAGAATVGPWVGLSPTESLELLPQLSDGSSIASRPYRERAVLEPPPPPTTPPDPGAWKACVVATAAEFGGSRRDGPDLAETTALLFLLRGRELAHRPNRLAVLVAEGAGVEAALDAELRTLVRRGWVEERGPGEWTTAPAGRAYLGEIAETGAVRESVEHRALLAAAFRIFARHGERLEIVRQGRFDTRLPDARWRVLSPTDRGEPAHRLAERLQTQRDGWGWRVFGGRDVHVEAEVSGAERRERIVRDLSKARAAGAHCLFLVGDGRRGRRIRQLLASRGVGRDAATVWVLGPTARGGAEVVPTKSPEG